MPVPIREEVAAGRKTPGRRKMQVEEEPGVWEAAMKEKILRDKDLHLRILRYEPIHFDLFLGIAGEETDLSVGKLKLRLRTFLDNQGIQFYGADPGRGRKKK
ncbi:hypothetical protein H0H81_011147 [Sphagnurus paluster]|uniref:Structure-specific endonuclease subunit SLX4 n=1 Tax=Sphagnurus paluster TaxID=117069 RepID=A0A9P7KFV7_9AGAR|nr:hypothetical protein H0H81_011147 [Sphagnurus paluster]